MCQLTATIDRNEITQIFYHSFAHAQGRLILQPDLFAYIFKLWKEQGVSIDPQLRNRDSIRQFDNLRVPLGHQQVDSSETKAQFGFWWETMWDVFDHQMGLIDQVFALDMCQRSLRYCGHEAYYSNRYESLKEEKILTITKRINDNRNDYSSSFILTHILLPNILSVETYFQGEPMYGPDYGRKRTDGGDAFESKLLTNCLLARAKLEHGKTLGTYDCMYLQVIAALEGELPSSNEELLQRLHRELIKHYNRNHPEQPVNCMYK